MRTYQWEVYMYFFLKCCNMFENVITNVKKGF